MPQPGLDRHCRSRETKSTIDRPANLSRRSSLPASLPASATPWSTWQARSIGIRVRPDPTPALSKSTADARKAACPRMRFGRTDPMPRDRSARDRPCPSTAVRARTPPTLRRRSASGRARTTEEPNSILAGRHQFPMDCGDTRTEDVQCATRPLKRRKRLRPIPQEAVEAAQPRATEVQALRLESSFSRKCSPRIGSHSF